MVERRKYRRFKSRLLITTLYRDEHDKIVTENSVLSEDIGLGGLRLVFPRRLQKGKILDLKVFLFSDPIHLPARGKVMWSGEKQVLELATPDSVGGAEKELYWIGIQFIDIDAFHRERILRWIQKEFHVVDL